MPTTMIDASLKKYDAPSDRIRLHLQGTAERVLVVEGPTDAEVLGELLGDQGIFPVGSRGNVLAAAEELMLSGIVRFVAVLDVDFLPLPSGGDWDAVLHPYLGRDLESMLIHLGGLHRLLRYKGSLSKIEQYGGIDMLVSVLLRTVEPITRLRVENARSGLGLCFDAVRLEDKIELRTLRLLLDSYCAALANISGIGMNAARVEAIAIDESRGAGEARGKDVIAVASTSLRRVAGSLPKAACEPAILARDLLAVSILILRESEWFADLQRRLAAA